MATKKQTFINLKDLIKLSLLFLFLISYGTAEVIWLDYDKATQSAEHEGKVGKSITYGLNFEDSSIPFYLKAIVTPANGTQTPIICFSSTDQNCLSNRVVINKRTDGKPIILFTKREQVREKNEFYVFVKCKEDDCSYKIRIEGAQAAEIEPNTVYSYLVSSDNREMSFEVLGEAESGSYLTIGIEGSTSAQLIIDYVDNPQYKIDTGRIVTYPLKENTNSNILSSFTIKGATDGDYVTLNVHIVSNDKAVDNFLYPNGPVVMGMLDSSYSKEECFPIKVFESEKYSNINKYYLTGKIHSKYALFWLADENDQFMSETEMEISDGQLSYIIETSGKKRSVCFEFSYESVVKSDYVAYSISILEPSTLDELYNFYPPQIIGQVYRRMIPLGSFGVFYGGAIKPSDKRYTFNMYNRKGVAQMYVDYCSSVPYCSYKDTQFNKLENPKQVNKMTIWDSIVEKDIGALDSSKNVMVVYCKDDDNESKGYCEVETSIFTQGQTVTLIENEEFSKYVLKEEKGILKMDFKASINVQRLDIDIMIYSGDVSFEIKKYGTKLANSNLEDEKVEYTYNKYYLSNKIYYHFNFAQMKIEGVELEYTAVVNSFFTIKYDIHPINLIRLEENVLSGESYLVEIDPTSFGKNKTIYLENYRYKKEMPFMANFFALNCEFQVIRKDAEIPFFDGYAQEILDKDTAGYNTGNYEYKITIKEQDLSNYNHKMCLLYVAGYETKDSDMQTEIIVAENINQQIIFDDNFKTIRFLYPLADLEQSLAIYFNVIDQAYYTIKIFINTKTTPFKDFTITRSQIYYIAHNEFSIDCVKDTLCNIIVEATFSEPLNTIPKTDPMLEITFRQIKNTPSYLQKGRAKRDFTCGDNIYYLYTDIGKNEVGEVSINFLRDFGNLWGKVVRKDQVSIDEDANWRGIYRMPSEEWEDSFVYDGYTKKFEVDLEKTKDCIEGCYLLLSVRISQIGDYVGEYKFYPFTIITRITPNNRAYTDIPKIVIQVDEYIVGNVDVSENERISQFYEIWFPHDSNQIDFDWQSKVAGLYINVGGTRPTTKNADFKLLPEGKDSILSLDKYYIIAAAKKNKIKVPIENSLQDLNLVIGIWTDKTDSINTELFSLRVHEESEENDIDITEVNTDQKILCTPRYVDDNQFRCLFMVTYDDEDVNLAMPLLVHSASTNQSAITNTYASFIEKNYYEEFDINNLRQKIPTSQTAIFSTLEDDVNYISTVLTSNNKDHYLFVSVIADKPDDIYIITSIPMYNIKPEGHEFYPNPSSEQLLSISGDFEVLNLKFFTTTSLIVNLVSLDGEAEITWPDDPYTVYNLRGREDRLTLTSGINLKSLSIKRRKILNNNNLKEDASAFVFYISYYIRDPENNFDEVQYGKSIEISYRDTDLPVHLYSKMDTYFNDINIAVTFRDSDIDTEGKYEKPPLIVQATLAKESTIYKSKESSELSPSLERTVFGNYDTALKTAQVFLSKDTIRSFNLKDEDVPTLYLYMGKNKDTPQHKYSKFNIETQFTKINSGISPAEKTYNYGRYNDNHFTNYYKLKNDKKKEFMIIELAFNSDFLDFAISETYSRTNASFTKIVEKARGKIFITITTPNIRDFIYLNIFKKNNNVDNKMVLNNYVFKYLNVKSREEFIDYKILDNNNTLSIKKYEDGQNNYTIECTFNKIDIDKDKANITYFFKVVENSTLQYGESYETIAVTESPYYTVYQRNPVDNKGKITLTAKGAISNWAYLQVIAQIQQDTILEYVAYKGIKDIKPPKKEENNDNNNNTTKKKGPNTTAFYIVGGMLIVLIIGLFAVVLTFQQKNKNLADQVKHISFQQNQAINSSTSDPDLLLQKNY